jgi:hypothetical protein
MSTVALVLLVVLALATAVFYVASGLHASPWARDVCWISYDLCQQPIWLAIATGVMAVVYLLLRGVNY